MLLEIDYTTYKKDLKLKKEAGKTLIFDPIRKKYLVFQPEELVRQLVLQYLLQNRKYNKNFIRTEKGLKVNDLSKRCDILLYNTEMQPFFLVECKAANIKLSQATFDQIARYNMPLQVKYLLITNGLQTCCCELDYSNKTYTFLPEVPMATF